MSADATTDRERILDAIAALARLEHYVHLSSAIATQVADLIEALDELQLGMPQLGMDVIAL